MGDDAEEDFGVLGARTSCGQDRAQAAFVPGDHAFGMVPLAIKALRKADRCPVCDHVDWCGISPDGTFAICMRVEQGATGKARNGGWLHRLKESAQRPGPRVSRVPMRRMPSAGFDRLAAEYFAALGAEKRVGLASSLGLSALAKERLRVGWYAGQHAYSFPMCDAHGNVLGIRLRKPDGRKFAVTGAK